MHNIISKCKNDKPWKNEIGKVSENPKHTTQPAPATPLPTLSKQMPNGIKLLLSK